MHPFDELFKLVCLGRYMHMYMYSGTLVTVHG